MSDTTTVAIVAVAAVAALLLYESSQAQRTQQASTENLLLAKVLQPAPSSANPLASLTSLIAPLIAAL